MTEDGKIFDYEPDWQACKSVTGEKHVSVNKSLKTLFRIIDFKKQTYIFSDTARVKRIRDINKILSREDDEESNKKRFLPLVNRICDEVYPIAMPYFPQTLTCFIEAFPGFSSDEDCVGILYFRDETNGIEEAEMIETKRYFKLVPLVAGGFPYEEIDEKTYNDVKQKWMRKEEDSLKDE